MYSFNCYYIVILNIFFNILTKDLPWFSGTKYANLYSLCSCIIKLHSRATVMKRKFTSPWDIVCRHLCLFLMLKLSQSLIWRSWQKWTTTASHFHPVVFLGKLVRESKCFDTPKSARSLQSIREMGFPSTHMIYLSKLHFCNPRDV